MLQYQVSVLAYRWADETVGSNNLGGRRKGSGSVVMRVDKNLDDGR